MKQVKQRTLLIYILLVLFVAGLVLYAVRYAVLGPMGLLLRKPERL